jgi:hypothetical protein
MESYDAINERERAVEAPSKNIVPKTEGKTKFFQVVFVFSIFLISLLSVSVHYAHADITTNLVGHWTFDSADTTWSPASTTNDTTGNGNTGALKNFYSATSSVPGPIGQALDFRSTNYVNLTTHTGLPAYSSTTPYSVSFWVNKSALGTGNQDIYAEGYNTDNNPIFQLFMVGTNKVCVFIRNTAGTTVTNTCSNAIIVDGTWHHISWVDNLGSYTWYVDNKIDKSGSYTPVGSIPLQTANIGAQKSWVYSSYFLGLIDDVRVYNRALVAGDVTQLYNLGYTPTVTTSAASSVTNVAATLNGNITVDNATASSTARGFAYGTDSALATVIATTSETGPFGTGAFTAAVSSLSASTQYYFRAYASTATSTGYGSIQTFTTGSGVGVPTVTTQAASSVDATAATGNGNITATGGANPTVRGFVYGLTAAYGATTTPENGSFTTGAFTGSITGLTCNTLYHVNSYATNSAGTAYGSDATFTTRPCFHNVYYSVGQVKYNDALGDLKTGTPTVTIASGVATFSVAQTGNIGVGDRPCGMLSLQLEQHRSMSLVPPSTLSATNLIL